MDLEVRVKLFRQDVDKASKDQSAVSGPRIEVYMPVNGHIPSRKEQVYSQSGSCRFGDATTTPGAAPLAWQPSGPMLQSNPLYDMEAWASMNASRPCLAELSGCCPMIDWTATEPSSNATEKQDLKG